MSSHQPFNTAPTAAGGAGAAAGQGGAAAQGGIASGHGSLGPGGRDHGSSASTGDVQHIHYLSEHIGALFLNDEYSDVALVVDGRRFDAHKVILAARSEYFRCVR